MSFLRWWAFCKLLGIGVILSALAAGFFLPWWRHADQDLVLVYEALLYLNHLPQEYFDHPGYGYFLVIGEWFRLLDGLGLLPVHSLEQLPPPADRAAFDAAWTQLVYAGRALSALLAAALVFAFAELTRRIFNDARLAGVAAVAYAAGMGIMTQGRQLRTEMVSGGLVMLALLLALLAARSRPGWRGPGLLAAAACCAVLAVTAKVQAVFVIMALPLAVFAFTPSLTGGLREPPAMVARSWGWALLALGFAGLAALPAGLLFYDGLSHWGDALHPYKPLAAGLSASGAYQGVVVGWIGLAALLFAGWRRYPAAYAAQGLAALVLGASVGFCALLLRYHPQNVIAVSNFIEQMFVFSSWRHGAALGGEAQVTAAPLLKLALEGVWRTLAIRTVVLHPDNIPQTLMVEWFVLYAAFRAWRQGRRAALWAMLGPLVLAWGLEAVFSLRGFQRAYAIYTDPLTILAGIAALRAFPHWLEDAATRRRIYAGLALLVALAHVWPVMAARRRVDPAQHCDWLPVYMPRAPLFSFCLTPPVPPPPAP